MAEAWFRDGRRVERRVGRADIRLAGAADDRRAALIEFVSANPTGPVTVASGRHAAYGDSLARVLEFAGQPVPREYYLNDAGGQIDLFGRSIAARIAGHRGPRGRLRGRLRAGSRARSPARARTRADPPALGRARRAS